MSNPTILVDCKETQECELTKEISVSVKGSKVEETRKHKKYGLAFNLISSLLLIIIGFIMLKVTGLYEGANSTTGKIILCVVISCCYLIAFRRGLYSE